MADSKSDSNPPPTDPDATQAAESPELVRLLDQYMAELNAGAVPDRVKLLAEHPELAWQLEQCLAGIEFIHRAATPAENPTQLGDFRILRELGRGGMGVVYEAEQLSLRRRVALKVLRFGAVADKEALERFQREGETIAHLHHTNIVPIFAIGSEQGVAYYAMQLIDGGSLADVMTRQPAAPNAGANAPPVAFTEIARWGLEAAEALAHAHQRGVIHRDVKPSNLLLDADGRVWLTDFGLARRMNDVTLTTVGLAGTPRYMSPEQANAVRRPIDHRTDIYSLGATLYELATGRPLFASETPHGVISQILTTEPSRPRSIRPSIPRDLETIVLKCLAKEPAQRYAMAQALADDLRAFREGRPVKARRARLPERAVRWVKTRRKMLVAAGIAAVATLVLSAGLFVAQRRYSAAQMVHVSMANDGAPLKVEVFDEAERDVVATFTAPTQEAQALAPGKYHVRISADGRLSETSLFDAAAGGNYQFTAGLSSRILWDPIDGGEFTEPVRIDGRDDLFVFSANKLRRLRGDTGQNLWEISLYPSDQPLVAKVLTAIIDYPNATVFGGRQMGAEGLAPMALVRPLTDLDGDGSADLIWASRYSAALVAVSGKTGKVLWCHRGQTVPTGGGPDASAANENIGLGSGTIVGQPLTADIEGKKVVVAICSVASPHPHPQVWLEGISAVNGETLWRRSLPPNDAANGQHPICASACGKLHGHTIGAIAYGNRLIGFDFLSGAPAWPDRVLDTTPPPAVRFCDLLGDGQITLLLVRQGPGGTPLTYGGQGELSIAAISPALTTPLWERPLPGVTLPPNPLVKRLDSLFDWPLVVDFTGKGQPEVVIPWVDYPRNWFTKSMDGHRQQVSCGVEVLDGRTGLTRWKRRLSGINQPWRPPQPDRMLAAPAPSADGYRELFVASCEMSTAGVREYVDSLSGSDGHSLWAYNQPDAPAFNGVVPGLSSLRWWQPGADRRPMLVVSREAEAEIIPKTKSWSIVLSASTGRVEHRLKDFGNPQIADLTGNGLSDLYARDDGNGKLRAIRGMPPVAWRMLTNDSPVPTADLNGDGIADLVSKGKAISGKDGRNLWENSSFAAPAYDGQSADLNGDGTPVLLSLATNGDNGSMTLRASSGRDGKPLWAAEFQGNEPTPSGTVLGCPVLKSGESPDVLFTYRSYNRGVSDIPQHWLVRIAGRDGQVRWRQPFSQSDITGSALGSIATADLDGDGVDDIVFWVPIVPGDGPPATIDGNPNLSPRYELRAYSGRDGRLLWRRPGFYDERPSVGGSPPLSPIPRPLVIINNGHPQVLITDVRMKENGQPLFAQVVSLDGRDGKEIWSWRGDDAEGMGFQMNWANAVPQAARTPAGTVIVVSAYKRNPASLPARDLDGAWRSNPAAALPKAGYQIVQLDMQGHVLARMDILGVHAPASRCRAKVWVYDLNGDGYDDLVWADETSIRAMQASTGNLLWESKLRSGNVADDAIRAILPAGHNYPATIAVSANDRLLGLAGPTGKIRWQCEPSEAAHGSILKTDDPLGLPHVFDNNGVGQSTCRLALPTDDTGNYLPAAPMDVERMQPMTDPRLLVPLPWRVGFMPGISLLAVIGMIANIKWALRRPHRWRRISALTGSWLGATGLIAFVWLWFDSRGLLPIEHYDWTDSTHWHLWWLQVLLLGAALMTVTCTVVFRVIRPAFRAIKNRKRLLRIAA